MYNNPYVSAYNSQASIDRINNQIAELEKIKSQLPMQQPAINQTFQLAPLGHMKYVNSIEDVNKEVVTSDTPFFSKDLSVMWLKNSKGEIKSYELIEIVQKDDKDLMIESLQMQINEMKGMIESAKSIDKYVNDTTKNEEPSNVSTVSKSTTKQKQSARSTK